LNLIFSTFFLLIFHLTGNTTLGGPQFHEGSWGPFYSELFFWGVGGGAACAYREGREIK